NPRQTADAASENRRPESYASPAKPVPAPARFPPKLETWKLRRCLSHHPPGWNVPRWRENLERLPQAPSCTGDRARSRRRWACYCESREMRLPRYCGNLRSAIRYARFPETAATAQKTFPRREEQKARTKAGYFS